MKGFTNNKIKILEDDDIKYYKSFNNLENVNNIENINNEENINNDDLFEYYDILTYLYETNNINFKIFDNNLDLYIHNNIAKYQLIIFINDENYHENNNNDINNIIVKYKNNIQVNIIEFGYNFNKKYELYKQNGYNYIFLDINKFNKKYKNNRALSYNIINYIFIKYIFKFEYYIFLINNEELIITNDEFNNVGGFDYELFFENSGHELQYFINKLNKSEYIKINENSIFNYYYKNIIKIYNKLDNNFKNMFINYLKNRNYINNYQNLIDIYLINLENREDRLKNTLKEFNKINIQKYNYFNAIVPNINEIKNCKIFNPLKLWKKNNIDYLISSLGCKMSHLEILKLGLKSDYEYIMILEDDVVFENNSICYLNLALQSLQNINWDILYLSINLKNYDDAEKVDNNLLKIKKGLTTTGQLFQKSKLKYIIELIEKSETEIDNTYSDLLENKYCVYPMCIYQRNSYSDINKKYMNYGKFHKKFIY
jgi:GR25 family glycosyltransferase involved in LPS biosynthesis